MCGPAAGGLTHPGWCWHVQAGQMMASTGPGEFPGEAAAASARTSPVGSFPADGDGRSDMIGNVWEWTSDYYVPRHRTQAPQCCAPLSERGRAAAAGAAAWRTAISGRGAGGNGA